LHADAQQYGEALEFLQWACSVVRYQADQYARPHLRRGMEAIRDIMLAPPTKRGDPKKFAEAYLAGMEGGELPKGANRQAAYRLGITLRSMMELYSSVESMAKFPHAIFNDHFENPDLSVEELFDRWDELRHPETVILQEMGEVFEVADEDPVMENTDDGPTGKEKAGRQAESDG
jgi:hypothetical protein